MSESYPESYTPTAEQKAMIEHPLNQHARVLAVAGSGKTTTLTHRIRYLLQHRVKPQLIRVVMYNKSAEQDFKRKLQKLKVKGVEVRTFHGMGNSILEFAAKQNFIPSQTLIQGGDQLRFIRSVIQEARRQNPELDEIDPLDVQDVIGAWKAKLVPPEFAHHKHEQHWVELYKIHEQERLRRRLITYDDMIYDAVNLIEKIPQLKKDLENRVEHFIVDEFQDVNLSRLRLLELLKGERAKVMVVGDDDQCIYEWQGARSGFIRDDFARRFPQALTYTLSRTFRFGPLIAQLASNSIRMNHDRVPKPLMADRLRQPSHVEVNVGPEASSVVACQRLTHLLESGEDSSQIVVLVRSYMQSHALQGKLFNAKVPFYVEGANDWKDLHEVRVILSYLRVLLHWKEPINQEVYRALKVLAHTPNRYLKRDLLDYYARAALDQGLSSQQFFQDTPLYEDDRLRKRSQDNLHALAQDLEMVYTKIYQTPELPLNAGEIIRALITQIDFEDFFKTTGAGETDEESMGILSGLVTVLEGAKIPLDQVHEFINNLDTRLGKPDEECIRITSIYKAKGLEWDHVFMPGLVDGVFPDLRSSADVTEDTRANAYQVAPTSALESERRLFYVGLTRARHGVYLFGEYQSSARPPCRFLEEIALHQTQDALSPVIHGRTLNSVDETWAQRSLEHPHLHSGMIELLREINEFQLADHLAEKTPKTFEFQYVYLGHDDEDQGTTSAWSDEGLPI